jgi:hypothetical protein
LREGAGVVSDFSTLDAISKRNGNIKGFVVPGNLKSALKSSKGQWGEVTIAVDNESVINLLNDNVIGILCLVTREEWEKEKALERGQE